MYCTLTDQCYREVSLEQRPLRIVSLVPSQTELLIDLGLEEHLAGITRYCVHPSGLTHRVAVMGGTKKVVEARLREAQPDLIICNKEENTPEIVLMCDHIAPTYVSDISNLDDAVEMIHDLGKLTGAGFKAKSLARKIQMDFNHLPKITSTQKALYLIWKNPYMSIGNDTFIHDIMSKAGLENVFKDELRYPELTLDQMVALEPEVILFSSEPYAFTDEDLDEVEQAFSKAGLNLPQCTLVDGELFSWYGSRLLKTPTYLKSFIK